MKLTILLLITISLSSCGTHTKTYGYKTELNTGEFIRAEGFKSREQADSAVSVLQNVKRSCVLVQYHE